MKKKYLSVKQSLGYKNLKLALDNVFNIKLDDVLINEGEFENFSLNIKYNNQEVNMGISSTEKHAQFQVGAGGMFDILFPNPDYPQSSILSMKFFHDLLEDQEKIEKVEFVFGGDEKAIEVALRILKDYLDNETRV